MLHTEARCQARRDQQGEFVPLDVQDPARWDGTLIDEAEALLLSASRMNAPGRFQLEAAVQSARAALLARTGSAQAAAEAYQRAIGLESDPAVRRFLQAELARVEEALVRKAG